MAVDWGVIALPSSLPLEERLFQLYSHLLNMISIWQPDAVAVEEPFIGKGERRFVGPAFAIGQAQALVLIAAAGQAIPVSRYSPRPGETSHRGPWGRHKRAGTADGKDGAGPRLGAVSLRCCRRPGHWVVPPQAGAVEKRPEQRGLSLITAIRGILEGKGAGLVKVRVGGGITIQVFVPTSTVDGLGKLVGRYNSIPGSISRTMSPFYMASQLQRPSVCFNCSTAFQGWALARPCPSCPP